MIMNENVFDTKSKPTGDGSSTRRWTHDLGELQSRMRKMRLNGGGVSPVATDLLDDALSLSMTLLQELAGAHLLNRKLQADVKRACANWDYLFDRVPVPCVVTDASGTIVSANRAAALFLNTSAKHLVGRLLLHFTDDREKFGAALLTVTTDRARLEQVMTIRPKERAPREMAVVTVPESSEPSGRYLWFLQPIVQPARTPDLPAGASDQITTN